MQSPPTRAGRVLAACLLIVLRPQHSPGRQIDEMQLRAGDASDGFVAVRIGRELIRRPALHKLACVRAMIEKCDHPQFNSTRTHSSQSADLVTGGGALLPGTRSVACFLLLDTYDG